MQSHMAKQQSITSLPRSPEDDRRARMLKYSIAMGVRLVCIFACFLVPGYWLIIPAVGAVVLPYVAVVLANVSASRKETVLRPDQLSLPASEDGRRSQ
jgi:predicted tellurium resistance membrane protein TerC